LKNAMWVSQQVLSNNFKAWSLLTVAEAQKKLAIATKEQIALLSAEMTPEGDGTAPRTRVEGGRPTSQKPEPKEEKKEQVGTPLTTLISRRREARRKAMLHQK